MRLHFRLGNKALDQRRNRDQESKSGQSRNRVVRKGFAVLRYGRQPPWDQDRRSLSRRTRMPPMCRHEERHEERWGVLQSISLRRLGLCNKIFCMVALS